MASGEWRVASGEWRVTGERRSWGIIFPTRTSDVKEAGEAIPPVALVRRSLALSWPSLVRRQSPELST